MSYFLDIYDGFMSSKGLSSANGFVSPKSNNPIPPVTANYYYFSTSGLDTNTGMSSASPLKTISKLNSMTFQPGDSILFKRGDVWSGKIVPPSDGTASKKIIFDAYGSGSVLPVISGSAETNALLIENGRSFLEFHNIKFTGNTAADSAVCKLYTHDILLEDCEIANASQYHGISGWSQTGAEIYNLTIRGCTIHDNYRCGVFLGAGDGTQGPRDCLVENNIVYSNGHSNSLDHGLYVGFGVTVRKNECYKNSSAGIKANNSDGYINPLYYSYFDSNKTHDNYYGIFLGASNVVVINNLVYDNTKNNVYLDGGALDCLVYNNSISNSKTDYGLKFGADTLNAHNIFKNNIICQDKAVVNGVQTCVWATSGCHAAIAANNTFNNNLYYYDGNVATAILGTYTFAQWKALSGSPDANGVLGYPAYSGSTITATKVSADSATGQKVLKVFSNAGFNTQMSGSQTIVISGSTGLRTEYRVIASLGGSGSITLTANLSNTHTAVQADNVTGLLYNDYHIRTTSAGKNAGSSLALVPTDYDGVARSATPSIGAFEFV